MSMNEEADLEAALAEEFLMEAAEAVAKDRSTKGAAGSVEMSAEEVGSRLYDILNW
jgi:hypothetical protein